MSEMRLVRVTNGFVPATDEDVKLLQKFKMGEVAKVDVVKMRNARFFRKWWALVKVGFDMWSDDLEHGHQEHHGMKVLPSFDRFRKEVTIMAGFFTPVWGVKGELRVEPRSLQWGKMSEEEFEDLYTKTIDVLLDKVLKNRAKPIDKQTLDRMVESVLQFA